VTLLDMSTGNRVHAITDRGNDLYQTPPEAVRGLLAVEDVPKRLWEPACGPGAIVRELRTLGHDVVATDLVDYGLDDSDARVDFLMETQAPSGVDAIITNPPFKNADEFVAKAVDLCPEVYMLLRVAFLEGLRWYETGHYNAKGLGAHLARVWVFAPRLDMMHREGWEGPKANSGMAFGWFVFKRDHAKKRGSARIGWLNPRDFKGD
jgi:predicted RNA methylase